MTTIVEMEYSGVVHMLKNLRVDGQWDAYCNK
jgi:hypothetical protein